jgi:hypothetical protein
VQSISVSDGWTDQSGTIDDLIADAQARGFPATARLIYDWVGLGLLDHPQRHSRGAQGGSDKAVWPWTQRNLFRLLVEKRAQVKGVAPLCNIPVAIWLWWGEGYVLTTQVQRALATWANKVEGVSWQTAKSQARHAAAFLDDLGAPREGRERLIDVLAKTAYSGQLDKKTVTEAIRQVFDPGGDGRVYGSSLMPVTPERFVDLMESRTLGMVLAKKPASVEDLTNAWHYCRFGMQSYAVARPALIDSSLRPQDAQMWEEPTWDLLVNKACSQVVLVLGGLSRHSAKAF